MEDYCTYVELEGRDNYIQASSTSLSSLTLQECASGNNFIDLIALL